MKDVFTEDISIECKDCGQEFAWTAGEQEFYAEKGLEDPTYCLICRGKYKAMEKDAGKYGKKVEKIRKVRG